MKFSAPGRRYSTLVVLMLSKNYPIRIPIPRPSTALPPQSTMFTCRKGNTNPTVKFESQLRDPPTI